MGSTPILFRHSALERISANDAGVFPVLTSIFAVPGGHLPRGEMLSPLQAAGALAAVGLVHVIDLRPAIKPTGEGPEAEHRRVLLLNPRVRFAAL